MRAIRIILIAISVLTVDIAVYIFFGLLLMNYEDFYHESEGEYWSLSSMTASEKVTYIGFEFWNLLNLFAIGYILYKIVRMVRKRRHAERQY